MRKLTAGLVTALALAAIGSGAAWAGQPNASCEASGANPPPGFSTGGFDNAEGHYAGSDGTPSQQHGNGDHAVSQYDVACVSGHAH